MIKKELPVPAKPEPPSSSKTVNNKSDVKVNNQISLTINLGDSLNLAALIAGIYIIRRFLKRKKEN